jgi:hypothetical protein
VPGGGPGRSLSRVRPSCSGRSGDERPEPPRLPKELDALLWHIRLPYLRRTALEVCATARAQRWEPAEVLHVLLTEKVKGRDAATRGLRRRAAGFPSGNTFEGWRPDSSVHPSAHPSRP